MENSFVDTIMLVKQNNMVSTIEMFHKSVMEKRNLIKDLYFDSRKT